MTKTTFIGICLALLLVTAVIFAFFFLPSEPAAPGSTLQFSENLSSGLETASAPPQVQREIPRGYKEYQASEHHFSILHPQVMTIAAFDEPGGAKTITFEDISDPNNLKGFQVYIAPHAGGEVTTAYVEQRIGTAPKSTEEIVIDGAHGLAFLSSDGALGEIREVWFAREGFLYQVATPRPLEALLIDVLKTWRFMAPL